jgi:hypothetical protein
VRHFCRQHQGERGTALLASVLLMALITGAGLAAVMTTSTNLSSSQNLITSKQAFYLAEAGLQHGRLVLSQQYGLDPNIWNTYAIPQTLIETTQLGTIGSYTVTIQNASGPGLQMTSTGTAPGNATATVTTLVIVGYTNFNRAFRAGRDLTISGDVLFSGTAGGVHANGGLTISGNPHFSSDATASGTYTVTGAPTFGGSASGAGGVAQMPINRVSVEQYYDVRDYLLHSDGKVYSVSNPSQPLPMPGGLWNCWRYISPMWILTCGLTVNGTLYANGNVQIAVDVGSTANPWIATIIAEGYIRVSPRTVVMRRPLQSDPGGLFKIKSENLLFEAGTDILVEGTPTQSFTGIMRAREQVSITGGSSVTGYFIANDAASNSSLVTGNLIGGPAQITYNGDMANGAQNTVQVMSTVY